MLVLENIEREVERFIQNINVHAGIGGRPGSFYLPGLDRQSALLAAARGVAAGPFGAGGEAADGVPGARLDLFPGTPAAATTQASMAVNHPFLAAPPGQAPRKLPHGLPPTD
jgi:hypothetical protein